ncbi:MAG TPA: hypothetical protein VMF89_32345 [Polyangiales bacterium]|nr:hypothetical protein [Polyangiales bacterium]
MSSKLWLGLAGTAIGFVMTARWARGLQKSNERGALAREDARFHRTYDALRQEAAHSAPTLVLFGGQFIFSDRAQRAEYPASAPASQLLKAAAHAPLGVYTLLLPLLQDSARAEIPESLRVRLMRTQATLERAERELAEFGERDGLSAEACKDSSDVLGTTREFVERTLSRGRVEKERLAELARTLGPRLLRLTEHATELELTALHAATEAALQAMTPDQRAKFEVVVAGAHQARDRSLPLQYFQKRFGEAPGEERRVAFAESVSGPTEALELVGTRRLDREIAAAFFGNPERLQRDVLGDAAQHQLKRHTFTRILASASEADSQATQQRTCLTDASSFDMND